MSQKAPGRLGGRCGFTLIELLIVIAIILILIAIALPNFLEAQIRAKAVRSAGESRSLGLAVESLRVDRNTLLIDIWDDDSVLGVQRLLQFFGGIANTNKATRLQRDVMAPLTTPVKYIVSIPQDPFLKDPKTVATSETWTGQLDTYTYFDRDPAIPDVADGKAGVGKNSWPDDHNIQGYHAANTAISQVRRLADGEFALIGSGPDGQVVQNGFRGVPYSPTNGTRSNGNITWRSAGTLNR
ncbi:MAG: prepilin-type N-terminal cleavage/methylation domain-containing protein [Candidatus Omnitrophica bacterium]|nr:prepilin-type N-terminal cleavage/methylation domain-containing protein [Candidatus Omnitrophota bacterium]